MAFKKGNTINLGRKDSAETRLKKSLAHQGIKPAIWGAGFKPGNKPWNKRGDRARNAYYAGLVDGEGYIALHKNGPKTEDNRYQRIQVRISIIDGDNVLGEGQKYWGGFIYKRVREGGSEYLEWVLQYKYAERFLISIRPYLRLKKEQAEIALKYRWLQKRKHPGTIRRVISEEELKYRKELEVKLKSLHLRKGVQTA